MDLFQQFIAKSRYARFLPDENRRENFTETIQRYTEFMQEHLDETFGYSDKATFTEIREAIEAMAVMPSMRCMMTAGPALKRDNTCAFNCSYLPVDSPLSFDEAMLILMNGSGVGFSVERQFVKCLPEIPDRIFDTDTCIMVKDSKEGWAKALRMLIAMLYAGECPHWDTGKVRRAGSRLKTFGGRASGPGPLEDLFKFVVATFRNAAGRRLTSIECHDIMCKIGDVIVMGGVRRSALISLSNLSDERMRQAKSGEWWKLTPHRKLSNNSVCYTERPDVGIFMKEWLSLYESKSGERGIFNREAAQRQVTRSGRREADHDFGCNPCSEIILRPYQFCNLSEVVAREHDDDDSLAEKVRLATMIGTYQSTLTNFPYLRKVWQRNTESERLLGVSITGIFDCPLLCDRNDPQLPERLEHLRGVAIETNRELAHELGIEPAAGITCVKPSGTVSLLVNAASGIHPRFAPYYIRRARNDNKDPLTAFMRDAGVPCEPDLTQPDSLSVFSFPIKAPATALTADQIEPIAHLELWKIYQDSWAEHKPSITVNVREREWPEVGAWVWKNFDEVSGVSFLPHDGGVYRQMPYEAVSKEAYLEMAAEMPTGLDFDQVVERDDEAITSHRELACSAGGCEAI